MEEEDEVEEIMEEEEEEEGRSQVRRGAPARQRKDKGKDPLAMQVSPACGTYPLPDLPACLLGAWIF
jgi:hypothetical protein